MRYSEFVKLAQITQRGFASTSDSYKFWVQHRLINYPANLQTIYKLVPVQSVPPPPLGVVSLIQGADGPVDIMGNPVTVNAPAVWLTSLETPLNTSGSAIIDCSGFAFGAADFSIELYCEAAPENNNNNMLLDGNGSGSPGGGIFVELSTVNGFNFVEVDGNIMMPEWAPDGVNRHFVVCRKAGFIDVARDGEWSGLGFESSWDYTETKIALANYVIDLGGWSLDSSITGFRVYNGESPYTPGIPFVPPTLPYPVP